MRLPEICFNKYFLMGLTASFMFSMFLYNVMVASVDNVKADFFTKADKIEQYVNENKQDIKDISKSTSRIEGKLDILLEKTP